MKEKIKAWGNEHSMYFIILTIAEVILSTVATLSFISTDSLSYEDSILINTFGIEKLLESIYSSTWWALILLLLFFIALFSVMELIYKKEEYMTLSIGCWIELLILSINIGNPIKDTLMNLMLFAPIFVLNIIAIVKEKNCLKQQNNEQEKKTKKKTSK
jgi:hypothetical protein